MTFGLHNIIILSKVMLFFCSSNILEIERYKLNSSVGVYPCTALKQCSINVHVCFLWSFFCYP